MKRYMLIVGACLGILVSASVVHASWGSMGYSGYQPWYNVFAKRNTNCSPEEQRLQKFWHDYYHAMKEYYSSLDHIDWVAYYKNHGFQINCGCGGCGGCCNRINYAPVFVSPMMQWAMPTSCFGGPGCGGPPAGGPGANFQGYPGPGYQ